MPDYRADDGYEPTVVERGGDPTVVDQEDRRLVVRTRGNHNRNVCHDPDLEAAREGRPEPRCNGSDGVDVDWIWRPRSVLGSVYDNCRWCRGEAPSPDQPETSLADVLRHQDVTAAEALSQSDTDTDADASGGGKA